MKSLVQNASILLYVSNAEDRAALRARLQAHGAHVEEIASPYDVERVLAMHPHAVSFIKISLSNQSGLAIIRGLAAEENSGDIVVLSSDQELECRSAARDAGATDFLSTPIEAIDLEMRLAQLFSADNDVEITFDAVSTPAPTPTSAPAPTPASTPAPTPASEAQLRTLQAALTRTREALNDALASAPSISGDTPSADVDELTGLPGSGPLQDYLDREYARARRYGHALSVLVIDIDKLSEHCRRYGEAAGDSAVALVADVLRGALRSPDIVTRPGSDSFAILATDTDEEQAVLLGNRLRTALATESQHASGPAVTVSIGIASAQRLSVSRASDLLAAAEQATAQAKREGRDRCCVATKA